MENYSKSEILQMVEEEDVEFIRLQFTDMFGVLKNVAIPSSRLIKAMENRCTIDTASLDGFTGGEECDLYLKPDLSTFSILPWRPQQGKVARFLCDVCREDGTEIEDSPRSILKRVVKKAQEKGYTLKVNPECEFFLFHTDDNGMPTTLTYENAMATADKIMTFKMAVRTIAKRYGLHATFMPKPRAEVNGSGMHLNMRLLKDGKNIFKGEDGALSAEGEAFLAGILYHIQGMTAVMNPLVNSYKRLVPGFEAPSEVTWSRTQRNALVHVRKEHGGEVNLELRSPDSASNPYLVFALCLAAGMEGIEKRLQVPEELTKDIRKLNEEEKKLLGIQMLPENLGEAIKAMGQDTLVSKVLGETYRKGYMKAKRKEWKDYLEQVSEWELNRYLYRV